MTIAEKLYNLRVENNLTQKDMAKYAGVSEKSISAWENGVRSPKIGPLLKLCDRFHLDPYSLIDDGTNNGITVSSPVLTPAGARVGKLYERASERDKTLVDTVLDPYDDGTLDFSAPAPVPARGPVPMKHYRPIEDGMDELDVFDEPAAAGLGNYLDAPAMHLEQYPHGMIPEGTDFGVRVSGDSMEPEIVNGSTVFVRSLPAIESGEIGVFVLNGQSYCKRLIVDREKQQVRLHSENPLYEDIVIGEYDDLRTLGRVLGSY